MTCGIQKSQARRAGRELPWQGLCHRKEGCAQLDLVISSRQWTIRRILQLSSELKCQKVVVIQVQMRDASTVRQR